jgi:hypothetical protein
MQIILRGSQFAADKGNGPSIAPLELTKSDITLTTAGHCARLDFSPSSGDKGHDVLQIYNVDTSTVVTEMAQKMDYTLQHFVVIGVVGNGLTAGDAVGQTMPAPNIPVNAKSIGWVFQGADAGNYEVRLWRHGSAHRVLQCGSDSQDLPWLFVDYAGPGTCSYTIPFTVIA